jgi:hypothetical protein
MGIDEDMDMGTYMDMVMEMKREADNIWILGSQNSLQ